MSVAKALTGLGTSAPTALATTGLVTTVTAAGTTQTNATILPFAQTHFNVNSGGSNSGVVFSPGVGTGPNYSPGDNGTIANTTGNTIKVWPPLGFQLNGAGNNNSVSMTNGQNCVWWTLDGNNFRLLIV